MLLASFDFVPVVCKGSEFLQFCKKIQSSMYKTFTQMYLTVSIGPSHMESSTELIKKFFFRWSPQFSAFEPPNKNPPNRYMSYQRPTTLPLSPETTLGDTSTQSLITNFRSFSPSQYTNLQFRSPQTRFTGSQKQYFPLLAPTSYYKVVNFSP